MRSLYTSFLLLALVPTGYGTSQQPAPDTERPKICVVDTKGFPTAVEFRSSLTVTQALKEAGINRREIKNGVTLAVKREDGRIDLIEVDLKQIEKRRVSDPVVSRQMLVQVLPKEKVTRASREAISAGCLACGCKLIPGMHGPLLVP